jgi:hypothetical protein
MDRRQGPAAPVSTFAEADYRFGTGLLTIRIERIDWANPLQQGGENWYEIEGVELTSDGREIGHRQALVKASSLASSHPIRRPS